MVQRSINILGKVLVIAFLLWHMFAVAVYSVPRDAKDTFAVWIKMDLLPVVTPYMYATSQWQLWNIFSPDPLRRVTSYRVDIQEDGQWKHLVTTHPDSYSIFRHATRMKLMGNMLDEFSDNRAPIAGRYMALLCSQYGVASGTPIRLTYDYYVLPFLTEPQTGTWWSQWQPEHASNTKFTTTCL